MAVSYTEGGITRKGSFDFTIMNGIRTPKQLKASYTGMQPIEQGTALSAKDFEVMAVYSDGVEEAISNEEQDFFLLSADSVPLQEGAFDVTVSLNPQMYGEDELPSGTLMLQADRARIGTWKIGVPNVADVQAVLYEEGDFVVRGNGNTKRFTWDTDVPWRSKRTQIQSVTIEETVRPTSMGNWFYRCNKLTEAPNIPDSVTDLGATFFECSNLIKAPEIPEGVINMYCTFAGCSKLTEAPAIPENVTNMDGTFDNCSNLIGAQAIPEGVTNLKAAFRGCSKLTKAPVIPENVTNMSYTFYNCQSLKGDLVINATPSSYGNCLYGAAIKGSTLYLSGLSTVLDKILATKTLNSQIEIKQ